MIDFTKQPEIHDFEKVELNFPAPAELSNGIPVWVVGDGDDEVNRLELYVGGGGFEEAKPFQAYLTALLSLEGNARMSAQQVAEALDYFGAVKSAQPYDHCTMLSLSSLNHNFDSTAGILFDSISSPIFSEEECELYRRRLASNVATARERVDYLANIEMMRLYYGENHPLAAEVTPEGLLGITTDELRRFHQAHYNADNIRIVFSGKVTDREMKVLDATIGAWNVRGMADNSSVEPPITPSETMLSVIDKKGALQSAVGITIRAIPRRHPDYFKLRLLVIAFGGYFGSRLNMNIREDKGYTYGIHSFLSGRSNDSYISIMSACATQHTWPLIEEVKKEMQLLRTQLMPDSELTTVKRHMISELVKTLDTPFSIARYVADSFTVGLYPEYFNDQVRAIMACTPADVMEMANKYLLDSKMRIVIAGDKQNL